MCQPLNDRKRPALADSGAAFNGPCWGLEGTSRDHRLTGPARATKWEFVAGAGWMDGKWNYMPSSDKWMSLRNGMNSPTQSGAGTDVLDGGFTFLLFILQRLVFDPVHLGWRGHGIKRKLPLFLLNTCAELHLSFCTRVKLFWKNQRRSRLRGHSGLSLSIHEAVFV